MVSFLKLRFFLWKNGKIIYHWGRTTTKSNQLALMAWGRGTVCVLLGGLVGPKKKKEQQQHLWWSRRPMDALIILRRLGVCIKMYFFKVGYCNIKLFAWFLSWAFFSSKGLTHHHRSIVATQAELDALPKVKVESSRKLQDEILSTESRCEFLIHST